MSCFCARNFLVQSITRGSAITFVLLTHCWTRETSYDQILWIFLSHWNFAPSVPKMWRDSDSMVWDPGVFRKQQLMQHWVASLNDKDWGAGVLYAHFSLTPHPHTFSFSKVFPAAADSSDIPCHSISLSRHKMQHNILFPNTCKQTLVSNIWQKLFMYFERRRHSVKTLWSCFIGIVGTSIFETYLKTLLLLSVILFLARWTPSTKLL